MLVEVETGATTVESSMEVLLFFLFKSIYCDVDLATPDPGGNTRVDRGRGDSPRSGRDPPVLQPRPHQEGWADGEASTGAPGGTGRSHLTREHGGAGGQGKTA